MCKMSFGIIKIVINPIRYSKKQTLKAAARFRRLENDYSAVGGRRQLRDIRGTVM